MTNPRKRPITLYRFLSLQRVERLLDILLNERLYCASYEELNDPFEGQFIEFAEKVIGPWKDDSATALKIFDPVHRNIGELKSFHPLPRICSLSTGFHDVRMWSHYADSHRGAAVEISLPATMPELHRVRYLENIRQDSDDRIFRRESTPALLLTEKTDHWSYEAEWRILSQQTFMPIKNRIQHIHFGTRTDAKLIELVERATQGKYYISRAELELGTACIVRGHPLQSGLA